MANEGVVKCVYELCVTGEYVKALLKANTEIYAALILCNESRNRNSFPGFKSTPEFWTSEARAELARESEEKVRQS